MPLRHAKDPLGPFAHRNGKDRHASHTEPASSARASRDRSTGTSTTARTASSSRGPGTIKQTARTGSSHFGTLALANRHTARTTRHDLAANRLNAHPEYGNVFWPHGDNFIWLHSSPR